MSVEGISNHRNYRGEDDFWSIRQFLQDTYAITPLGMNWEVRRWDGVVFYAEESGMPAEKVAGLRLWEDADENLVGAVFTERPGEVHLFVHPEARELESEMLAWAEDNCVLENGEGRKSLRTFCLDDDRERKERLELRGYQPNDSIGVFRRRSLPIPAGPIPRLPTGYKVARTRPGDECVGARIADLLNAAFMRDFHTAKEFQTFSLEAPSYQQACDLLAVAENGTYAAYVAICWDDKNELGIIEPVCTHPDHLRKKLASTLIHIGLRCLQDLGGKQVVVSTGALEPANKLYDSFGFEEKAIGHDWVKQFDI